MESVIFELDIVDEEEEEAVNKGDIESWIVFRDPRFIF